MGKSHADRSRSGTTRTIAQEVMSACGITESFMGTPSELYELTYPEIAKRIRCFKPNTLVYVIWSGPQPYSVKRAPLSDLDCAGLNRRLSLSRGGKEIIRELAIATIALEVYELQWAAVVRVVKKPSF